MYIYMIIYLNIYIYIHIGIALRVLFPSCWEGSSCCCPKLALQWVGPKLPAADNRQPCHCASPQPTVCRMPTSCYAWTTLRVRRCN